MNHDQTNAQLLSKLAGANLTKAIRRLFKSNCKKVKSLKWGSSRTLIQNTSKVLNFHMFDNGLQIFFRRSETVTDAFMSREEVDDQLNSTK